MEKQDSSNKNHLVLARKYRPQVFAELVGQEVLSTTIQNAIKLDRVAHAFILTGIRGVGKTTTARIVAKALNCTGRANDTAEPCGKCDSCLSITQDRNIDVIEIDAASHTGIDNIRDEIIDKAKYAPSNSKYKVYIIDEVHMLSKGAFNALLKTLEEPPAHTKFILATTEIQKVPVTILSRCQRFELKRIKHDELISFLKAIADQEKIQYDEDALSIIAKAAEGSVRDSLSIMDQAASFNNNNLTGKNIAEMLGRASVSFIYDLLENILKGEAAAAVSNYQNIVSGTTEPEAVLNQLLEATHSLTIVKIGTPQKGFNIENSFELAEKLATNVELSTLTTIHQALLKGLQELYLANDAFSCGEMVIIRLAHLASLPTPEELLNEVKKKELAS